MGEGRAGKLGSVGISRANLYLDSSGRWHVDLRAHPGLMLSALLARVPDAAIAIRKNRLIPGKVDLYQVVCLFMLARQYDRFDSLLVDFGTMYGWSASMLAAGAPLATVHTLEPKKEHRVKAKANLRRYGYRDVVVHSDTSLEFQAEVKRRGIRVDLVFVDGNHHHCEDDVGWWDLIAPGGVMLFHDYTRKYRSVVDSVDELLTTLGKEKPDIRLINARNGQGMVGVYA